MPHDRLSNLLQVQLDQLSAERRRKGFERVITERIPGDGVRGPRYRVAGYERTFIRMNSNSYLGLAGDARLIAAAEAATHRFGVGPGAVRFISGTLAPHVALEQRLATFHQRDAAMLFSSAYATVLSVITSLTTPDTAIISDELNHNCIINAIRLARPREKLVYRHLDLDQLDAALTQAASTCRRAIVVTDGIFSMRGMHAPLDQIAAIVARHDAAFAENALLIVDDSHGVGAFGATGRGCEEYCGARADLLIGTLGKAFGANGGYVVGPQVLIDSLRETSPTYIYSNPITAAEASAALAALDILASAEGQERLAHVRAMTTRFRQGLVDRGFETLPGDHPIVPLFVRNPSATAALVDTLFTRGVLATAIMYPVVPRGDDSIRFQISAEHTAADIDEALAALR
ncbi:pyridoxal phosphate-dependent aminotransferase family protein [Chloroflexus sp.]|uniref:aminotransferase class I/II-fold pyridoxal phosphate-dependent enzyme n=1 Tax=Chloroflexus sp. TaxID=1904827 RepID=UPI00298EF510|nr:pyridoxal phosphate-dependent aminotransferase family protein [Chloroflexus sp.]MDW8404734.1 pyridoxal phosphate-dependent aminotransferase family protein [Chloroflexus sp.]